LISFVTQFLDVKIDKKRRSSCFCLSPLHLHDSRTGWEPLIPEFLDVGGDLVERDVEDVAAVLVRDNLMTFGLVGQVLNLLHGVSEVIYNKNS
jgi:hypothetical protein